MKNAPEVKVLTLISRAPSERLDGDDTVGFSLDGAALFTLRSDTGESLWDAASGKLLFTYPKKCESTPARLNATRPEIWTAASEGCQHERLPWTYRPAQMATQQTHPTFFRAISPLRLYFCPEGKRLLVEEIEEFEPRSWLLDLATGRDLAQAISTKIIWNDHANHEEECIWLACSRDTKPPLVTRLQGDKQEGLDDISGLSLTACLAIPAQNGFLVGFENGSISLCRNKDPNPLHLGRLTDDPIERIFLGDDGHIILVTHDTTLVARLDGVLEVLGRFDGQLFDITRNGRLICVHTTDHMSVIDVASLETTWSINRAFGSAKFSGNGLTLFCTPKGPPSWRTADEGLIQFDASAGFPVDHGFDRGAYKMMRQEATLAFGDQGFVTATGKDFEAGNIDLMRIKDTTSWGDGWSLVTGARKRVESERNGLCFIAPDQSAFVSIGASKEWNPAAGWSWKRSARYKSDNDLEFGLELDGNATGVNDILVRFTPDSRHIVLVTIDGMVQCYNVSDASSNWQKSLGPDPVAERCLAVSREANISLCMDSRLRIMDYENEAVRTLHVSANEIDFGVISSDGRRLLIVNRSRIASVWDSKTGEQLDASDDLSHILCLSFSLCGKKFVTAHQDGRVNVWNSEDAGLIATAQSGHSNISACGINYETGAICILAGDHLETWAINAESAPAKIARKIRYEPSVSGWPLRFVHDLQGFFDVSLADLESLSGNDIAFAGMRSLTYLGPDGVSGTAFLPTGPLRNIHHGLAPGLKAMQADLCMARGLPTWTSRRAALNWHGDAGAVYAFKLNDYAQSLHFGRIKAWFEQGPLEMGHDAAVLLSRILTRSDHLLISTRSTALLAELVTIGLTHSLFRMAKTLNAHASRFGDTIFISERQGHPIEPGLVSLQKAVGQTFLVAGKPLAALALRAGFRLEPVGKIIGNVPELAEPA